MDSFQFEIQFGRSEDLCIRSGVVVPIDTIVNAETIQPCPWYRPTLEASLQSFKMLFGVKRRKAVTEAVEDDEEPKKVVPKVEDSDDSSDSEYEESMDSDATDEDDIDEDE